MPNHLNPYPCPCRQARGCAACKQTGREHIPHPEIAQVLKDQGVTDRAAPLMDREAWERSNPPADVAAEGVGKDTRRR